MIVHNCEQRSQEWVAARLGRLTSSDAAEMLAVRRDGKEAAGRRNLRVRLALERIVGRSLESGFMSNAMRQGQEREADALTLYEGITGVVISTVGHVAHDTLMAGCSPDGYVGDFEGVIEAKCPLPATHLDYLRTGVIPTEYQRQIQHHLWITGARWCDWLSFCPDFPEHLQVKLVRVERVSADIAAYELLVRQFLNDVQAEYDDILKLKAAA